jgi:hypothetical protein
MCFGKLEQKLRSRTNYFKVDGDEDDDDDDEIGANLMNIIGEGDSFEEDDEDASSSDQINESDLRRYDELKNKIRTILTKK